MTVLGTVNSKEAFLFLKNLGTLASLDGSLPALEDLTNSAEAYVDKSLKLFKETLSEKRSNEEAKSQIWEVISRVLPKLHSYTLDHIFCAALHIIPGSSEADAQQIFTHLKENRGIDLNQAYKKHYATQFLTWAQSAVRVLPSDSYLLLLNAWQQFGQPVNKADWDTLLCLSGWSKSQKIDLNKFKSQHDFIVKNHKNLQYIRLKDNLDSATEVTKEVNSRRYFNQYVLWVKALNSLLFQISAAYRLIVVGFKKGSWEYQLLHTPKKISSKILIHRGQIILSAHQEALRKVEGILDKKFESLREKQEDIRRAQRQLERAKEENTPIFLGNGSMSKAVETVTFTDAEKKGKIASKQQIELFLQNLEKEEKLIKITLKQFIEFKQSIISVQSLRKQLVDSFSGEAKQRKITQEKIALIERNQKELLEEENKCVFESIHSKKASLTQLPLLDSDSEIEEALESFSGIQACNSVLVSHDSFTEIDLYLENPNQINGVLSKAINRVLQKLKIHLLKIDANIPDKLKFLQKEKAYEVHAQLVLAIAAQEQMLQAIQDRRWDHVVLGFRSTFIHCHFAVEQILSLKILLRDNEITTTHDLVQLAEKARIEKFQEWRAFLQDVGMHLCFCYPEDYRLFFGKEIQPQPFIFLGKLSYPYKDIAKKKLDIDLLKKAVQLCFARCNQTMKFIAEVSLAPRSDLDRFLGKVNKVQQQAQNSIEESSKKRCEDIPNSSGIFFKCCQALELLNSLDTLENLPDFEGRVPLDTIKEYLKLMKTSLAIPRTSNAHSLQKVLQIEALSNLDKLFQHLFRAILLLQTGEDNHSHNLLELLQLVENFYLTDVLAESDKSSLKEINLGIAHHYLHKESRALLKTFCKDVFDLGCALLLAEDDFSIKYKKRNVSYRDLEKKTKKVLKKVDIALGLFIKLLNPVVIELKQLNVIS